MQYKVPQNVDMADKVIGPLTLRQFMIILIGAAAIILLNFTFVGYLRILFWFFAAAISSVVCAFSFVKYGDQDLEIFALSAYKSLTSPRQRIWKKTDEVVHEVHKAPAQKEEPVLQKKNLQEARNDFQRLAELVDSGGFSKLAPKDRVVTQEMTEADDAGASDLLQATEQTDAPINTIIEKEAAKTEKAPVGEPKISQLASVSPNKEFEYPKIEVHR